MTLLTGTKKSSRGFSLIEVLITVSLLGLATVFITQANLLSGAVYGRYANRLDVQNWAAQKLWEVKEAILIEDFPDVNPPEGTIEGKTRPYQWKVTLEQQQEKLTELYGIHLEILWKEAGQDNRLDRYGAVMKVKGP
ncbi:MAG: prepilin-type N-terminal cleavage/methylation domain-containing protein [Candidatus Omnitrophota bacterium]